MADLKKTLITACTEAGKILLSHLGKIKEYDIKGSIGNIVTVADKESEQKIIEIINSSFPSHTIMAEESGITENPGEYRWLIDPLDGTLNYSHTFPFFCVSIGIEYENEVIMGGIYAPVLDEFYFAERGKGAVLNGEYISVSKNDSIQKTLVIFGFPHDTRKRIDEYLFHLKNMMLNTQGALRLGSAALDFCSIARGRADAYYEQSLFPWDVAAGSIIVEEAGGKVTDYSNNKFSPYSNQFLATNGLIHKQIIEILNK